MLGSHDIHEEGQPAGKWWIKKEQAFIQEIGLGETCSTTKIFNTIFLHEDCLHEHFLNYGR